MRKRTGKKESEVKERRIGKRCGREEKEKKKKQANEVEERR